MAEYLEWAATSSNSGWAMSKLVRDEIADRVGIPTLALEVDCIDGRVIADESTRAVIKDFLTAVVR